MKIKNSKEFTSKVSAMFSKWKANAKGIVSGSFKLVESARGGITRRFADMAVQRFLERQRRDLNLANKGNLSLLEVCDLFASLDSIDKVLKFYFNSEKERVKLNAKQRQQRLNALSRRIVSGFADEMGLTAADAKTIVLSNADMLAILKAAAAFYKRATIKYVAPARKVKVVKAKTSKKTATTRRPAVSRQPQASV